MVAGTGVPMKVDTGLFSIQPIERDPTVSHRTEHKAQCIMYRHQEKRHVRLCHTAKCTIGIFSLRKKDDEIAYSLKMSVKYSPSNNMNLH